MAKKVGKKVVRPVRSKVVKSKLFKKTRPAKGPKEKEFNKCMRCDKEFPSRALLKSHLKIHQQALHEIKMLEDGFVPIESKIGLEFKGKNRVIIS